MAKRLTKKNSGRNSPVDARSERQNMIGPAMSFAASEAYKLLRTNLMFSFSGSDESRIIGMTSSFRGEGKSLTSVNLAYALAETQKKVLLIEGDMRLPTLSQRLHLSFSPGLSNLLAGISTVGESIQTFRVDVEDNVTIEVDVLVSGDIPPNPSELLGAERMLKLLEALREHYEYIILDLPPVTAVTDALVACKLVDGMVIVVRNKYTVRDALAETIRQLRLVDAHILGFVFNGATEDGSGYYKGKSYNKKNYYRNHYYQK